MKSEKGGPKGQNKRKNTVFYFSSFFLRFSSFFWIKRGVFIPIKFDSLSQIGHLINVQFGIVTRTLLDFFVPFFLYLH
jgi:hypothetical protein